LLAGKLEGSLSGDWYGYYYRTKIASVFQ